MAQGHDEAHIEKALEKHVTALRIKTVQHMKKTRSEWVSSWTPDPESNEAMEAGSAQESVDEYIKALDRPKRWVDLWVINAMAAVVNSDITLCKLLHKKWER